MKIGGEKTENPWRHHFSSILMLESSPMDTSESEGSRLRTSDGFWRGVCLKKR